ncbi:MAG: hypothetical protein MJ221_01450 [Bacilli bacterium]|nr:hypothetical protein [Bacilli bacterium]
MPKSIVGSGSLEDEELDEEELVVDELDVGSVELVIDVLDEVDVLLLVDELDVGLFPQLVSNKIIIGNKISL